VVGPHSGSGANTVAATVGTALPSTNNSVVASQGTGSITYSVTSGLLPFGLTLNSATGLISGTPTANTQGTYTVTVTATDSANVPVTGTSTFVVTVAGGLFMSNSAPTVSTFAAANSAVSTVSASGGVFPYVYSIAIPGQSLPTGLAVDAATGVVSTTAATPAGSYTVVVSAHDSTAGTPLTGSATFTIVVKLALAASTPASITGGNAGNYTTISATGNTGTVTFTTAAALPSWASLDPSTGVLSVTSSSVTGTTSVTVIATDGTAPASASAAGTGSITFNLVIN